MIKENQKITEQIEVARLKCELAKEKAKTSQLKEEIIMTKKSLNKEILLLQETVVVQR